MSTSLPAGLLASTLALLIPPTRGAAVFLKPPSASSSPAFNAWAKLCCLQDKSRQVPGTACCSDHLASCLWPPLPRPGFVGVSVYLSTRPSPPNMFLPSSSQGCAWPKAQEFLAGVEPQTPQTYRWMRPHPTRKAKKGCLGPHSLHRPLLRAKPSFLEPGKKQEGHCPCL